MVTLAVNPPRYLDGLPRVLRAELAAGMGAIGVHGGPFLIKHCFFSIKSREFNPFFLRHKEISLSFSRGRWSG
jgi:hypothetical protein